MIWLCCVQCQLCVESFSVKKASNKSTPNNFLLLPIRKLYTHYNWMTSFPFFQVVELNVVMHCEGCAGSVRKTLKKIPGICFFSRLLLIRWSVRCVFDKVEQQSVRCLCEIVWVFRSSVISKYLRHLEWKWHSIGLRIGNWLILEFFCGRLDYFLYCYTRSILLTNKLLMILEPCPSSSIRLRDWKCSTMYTELRTWLTWLWHIFIMCRCPFLHSRFWRTESNCSGKCGSNGCIAPSSQVRKDSYFDS